MKHLGLRHVIRILVGLALVVSLSGCPDMFGPRANPFDPEGDGYQGFDQVDDVNDVYPLPAGDQEFLWLPEIASVGSSGALAYNFLVERPDGDTYTAVFTTETSVPSTSLVDGNVTAGTYTYRVQAKGPDGAWGAWSERSTVRLAAGPAIVTPVADAVIADTTPAFDWEPVAEAASYELQIVEEDAGFAGAPVLSIDGDGYTATTALSNNTRHQWRVRAVNADGKRTVWSTPVSFTVGWGAMAGLSPADGATVEDTTPTFGWSGVDGAVKYQVQLADAEAALADAAIIDVDGTSWTPSTGLANLQTHYWRVRAIDSDGQATAWSGRSSVRVVWGSPSGMSPADGAVVEQPTPLLSWAPVEGAETYQIQIAATPEATPGASELTVASTSYTYTTGLGIGEKLYWRVRSIDNSGVVSQWSPILELRYEHLVIANYDFRHYDSLVNPPYHDLADWTLTNHTTGVIDSGGYDFSYAEELGGRSGVILFWDNYGGSSGDNISVSQEVSIPSWATTLRISMSFTGYGTRTYMPNGHLNVFFDSNQIISDPASSASDEIVREVDISSYAGDTVTLRINRPYVSSGYMGVLVDYVIIE